MSLLTAKSLSIEIGERRLCNKLDFVLESGEHWGVLGGNGIGKTTLLHTFAGLRTYRQGEVFVDQKELREWKRRSLACMLGVLFQDSSDTFPVSVMETVLAGRHPHTSFLAMETKEDMELAKQALQEVSLDSMLARQVNTLSGGERRRLAIATMLLQSPLIWLLDEPTNHLDLHHQITLLNLIKTHVDKVNGGLIMVLHDVNLVKRFCTHAMLMVDADNIILGPVNEVINKDNLELLYHHPIQQIAGEAGSTYFLPG